MGVPLRDLIDPEQQRRLREAAGVDDGPGVVDASSSRPEVKAMAAADRKRKPTMPGTDDKFPIGNVDDLRNAIRLAGHSSEDTAKVQAWIRKRARELGATNLIPDSWSSAKADDELEVKEVPAESTEIEHKADPGLGGAQVLEANDDTGRVVALVSVTGVEDRVKDIIEPGAYTETLAKREPIGVWSHDDKTWVARTEHAEELMPGDPFFRDIKTMDGQPWPKEAGAVKVEALFNLETPHGKAAYSDVKFFKGKTGWSIGYRATKAMRNVRTGVRRIKSLDWFEYSPVMVGAASQPMTLAVKSLAQPVDPNDPTGIADDVLVDSLSPGELGRLVELKASLGLEVKDAGSMVAARYLPCPKCHGSKVKMDDGKAVCANCGTPLTKKVQHKDDVDDLEVKDHVRTPGGAKRFGQPIGTEIVRDKVPASKLLVGDHVDFQGMGPGGPSDPKPVTGNIQHIEQDGNHVTITVNGEQHKLLAGSPLNIQRAAGPTAPVVDPPPPPKPSGVISNAELQKLYGEAQTDEQKQKIREALKLDPAKRAAFLQPSARPDAAPVASSAHAPAAAGDKPPAGLNTSERAGWETMTSAERDALIKRRDELAASAGDRPRKDPASGGLGTAKQEAAAKQTASSVDASSKYGAPPAGVDADAWRVANENSLDGLDPAGEDKQKFQRLADQEGVSVDDLATAADALGSNDHAVRNPMAGTAGDAARQAAAGNDPVAEVDIEALRKRKQAAADLAAIAQDQGVRSQAFKDALAKVDGPTAHEFTHSMAPHVSGAAKYAAAEHARQKGFDPNSVDHAVEDTAWQRHVQGGGKDIVPPKKKSTKSLFDSGQLAAVNVRRRARGLVPVDAVPLDLKGFDLDVIDTFIDDDPEVKMAHENLNRSPRVNWVERAGQLPAYIQHIAKDISDEKGVPLDHAIPLAIGAVKRWASGGGNVTAETRAKAATAVSEWEALKAKAHAKYDSELLEQIQYKATVELDQIEDAFATLFELGVLDEFKAQVGTAAEYLRVDDTGEVIGTAFVADLDELEELKSLTDELDEGVVLVELKGYDLEEKRVAHVRDVNYWHKPYGTLIIGGSGRHAQAVDGLRVAASKYKGFTGVVDNNHNMFQVGQAQDGKWHVYDADNTGTIKTPGAPMITADSEDDAVKQLAAHDAPGHGASRLTGQVPSISAVPARPLYDQHHGTNPDLKVPAGMVATRVKEGDFTTGGAREPLRVTDAAGDHYRVLPHPDGRGVQVLLNQSDGGVGAHVLTAKNEQEALDQLKRRHPLASRRAARAARRATPWGAGHPGAELLHDALAKSDDRLEISEVRALEELKGLLD